MRKNYTDVIKITEPTTHWDLKHDSLEYDYDAGIVITPLGYVLVDADSYMGNHSSVFRTIIKGKMYIRHVPKKYTRLGLSRLAYKFIKELYEKEE